MFPPPPFPLKREPTASAPRGDTLSTRIDKYRLLLCHCALCASYATTRRSRLYYPSSSAFAYSPPCGSHSEYAHSVNKYTLNKCTFYPLACFARFHQADNLVTIYIISFPGDVSTSLNMTIRCGCSHPCHSERKRGNPADRRTHQASTRTELRFEFLSISF